jgi:hypothetical protein
MNAPGGPADRTVTQTVPGGLLPPLPANVKLAAAGKAQMNELTFYLQRKAANKPAVDPLATTHANYLREMKKIGLGVTKLGKVYTLPSKAGKK